MSQYDKYSDAELLTLLKNGNERSFTEIYRRYWKQLIDIAYRRLKDEDEAREIVQEILVSFYFRKEQLNTELLLSGYLHSALKFRILNYFRHKVTKERYAEIISKRQNFNVAEAELQMERNDLAFRLRSAAEQLPPRCREVFLLSKIDHLNHKEIAERLGISVSTVEKHVAKGMELMRKHLGTYDSGLITVALTLIVVNT
jgi:RNA polymerase sigma-70 factor (family 1)